MKYVGTDDELYPVLFLTDAPEGADEDSPRLVEIPAELVDAYRAARRASGDAEEAIRRYLKETGQRNRVW